ncbi:MAG: response regulator [bacterium]
MSIQNKKKKILVIDDNSGILFVMQEALKLKGYVVQVLESFTGVIVVEKSAPDLIYLDVSLVGQDGRKVAQELKKYQGTSNIPIVMLTAYPNAEELAKEAGADDYLSKPFDLKQLWKMTEKYILSQTSL